MESYGVRLNQRLIYATAARERGHNIPLDEEWEQWLKEARERGNGYDMVDVDCGLANRWRPEQMAQFQQCRHQAQP